MGENIVKAFGYDVEFRGNGTFSTSASSGLWH